MRCLSGFSLLGCVCGKPLPGALQQILFGSEKVLVLHHCCVSWSHCPETVR